VTVVRVSQALLDDLLHEAAESPRRRQHRNLHTSYTDPCQRLLNAIELDSYIRPHRHALDPKVECLFAVRGKFSLITFDERGSPERVVRFGTELHGRDGQLDLGVEVPAATWHTVIALVPGSVLLEVKAGPFDPHAAKELAPWAPEEHSVAAESYFQTLRRVAES
jgi:cupin fold WbuC family metalloprotein